VGEEQDEKKKKFNREGVGGYSPPPKKKNPRSVNPIWIGRHIKEKRESGYQVEGLSREASKKETKLGGPLGEQSLSSLSKNREELQG